MGPKEPKSCSVLASIGYHFNLREETVALIPKQQTVKLGRNGLRNGLLGCVGRPEVSEQLAASLTSIGHWQAFSFSKRRQLGKTLALPELEGIKFYGVTKIELTNKGSDDFYVTLCLCYT